MINQILENLENEKKALNQYITNINHAIETVNEISNIEKEIIEKVKEIKLLKNLLLSIDYTSNMKEIEELTSPELLALEKSIDIEYSSEESTCNNIGKLRYIGKKEKEYLDEIIEDNENTLYAEKVIDASLDEAVEEMEKENKSTKKKKVEERKSLRPTQRPRGAYTNTNRIRGVIY